MNKRQISSIFIMVISFILPMIVVAKAPDSIRIGLESVYKDVGSVHITSETPIKIGYKGQRRWQEEGFLEACEIDVALATEKYYAYPELYTTYDDARRALKYFDSDAVVAYSAPGEYWIYTTHSSAGSFEVEVNPNRIRVNDEIGKVILISENDQSPLGFQGSFSQYDFPATKVGSSRLYRGVIEVVKGQYKGVTAVNEVDMEAYLYGVVPCEMSASWHEEALKAQAVASRSMATFQYNRFTSRGYNLVDTTTSQVYRGITSEALKTTAAVEATRGEVATYNGQVAETLYSASSGGYTEDPQYVWGNKVGYLQPKQDPYETDNVPWTRTITLAELEKCVADDGKDIGAVKGIEIVSYSPSGRVSEMKVLGTTDVYTLTRENVRTFFAPSKEGSLKSRMFKFSPYEEGVGTVPPITKPEQNLSGTVNVLTADEKVATEIEGLWIESADSYDKVKGEVYVQSVSGVEVLGNQANEGSNTESDSVPHIPQGETTKIYGDVTLYGKGYGHGVGMSQYGAKGMAEAGFSYEEIIAYYFEGVVIE